MAGYVGDGFLETTITEAGESAWALVTRTIRPGAYRMMARCQKVEGGQASSGWRVEAVQGNADLSGVAASLTRPAAVFDADTSDDSTLLTSYVDLGVVTLPARAGTLSVPSGVAVPLGIRVTRLAAGDDQLRIDALVILPVDAVKIRSTQTAVVELRQTVSSGDAPPDTSTDTALVLDSDQGLSWIQSPQGVEAGIPGIRGTYPRLTPGYDNVLYLLQQTGARVRGVPDADYTSDDVQATTDLTLTYAPAFTFGVTIHDEDDDE